MTGTGARCGLGFLIGVGPFEAGYEEVAGVFLPELVGSEDRGGEGSGKGFMTSFRFTITASRSGLGSRFSFVFVFVLLFVATCFGFLESPAALVTRNFFFTRVGYTDMNF